MVTTINLIILAMLAVGFFWCVLQLVELLRIR